MLTAKRMSSARDHAAGEITGQMAGQTTGDDFVEVSIWAGANCAIIIKTNRFVELSNIRAI